MIAEAIERIRELALQGDAPQVIEVDDQKFSSRPLHRVPNEPIASPDAIRHSSLRSLVEYLRDDPDEIDAGSFLAVASPTHVALVSPTMGADEDRKIYAQADALVPTHRLGAYLSLEEFGIYVRTCFVEIDERDALVSLVSKVSDTTEVETQDDGLSQTVQMKQGLSMVKNGETPGVVYLAPFRTFHDVAQPPSPFVLRLQKGRGGVEAALFTADGGAWKREATENVALYLRGELGDAISVYA